MSSNRGLKLINIHLGPRSRILVHLARHLR
jgi:hypothetical protein